MTERARMWSLGTRLCFCAFLLASPLNLYGFGAGAFTYRFSRLFLVLTFCCMALDAGANNRRLLKRLQLFDVCVLAYASLALLSGIYALNYSAYFARLFGLFEVMLILYVIRLLTTTLQTLQTAIKYYVLSATFVICAAFYQLYGLWHSFSAALPFQSFLLYDKYEEVLAEVGHFGGVTADFMRISSTFGEPDMMGGYCASILPFIVALVLIRLSERKHRAALGYALLGLGVVLTLISAVSKAAVLCVIASMSVFVYLIFPTLAKRQKRVAVTFCAGMLVSIFAYGFAARDLFIQRLELGDSGHLEHRMEALHAYLQHPLIGFGYGNYEVISAHTLPLTGLVELGVLGGIITFLLSVVPLLGLSRFRYLRSNNSEVVRLMLFAASYASYCSVLIGLYLYDYWIHPFTWISISLLMSMISQAATIQSADAFPPALRNDSRAWLYQPNTTS
jgi:hypothetical protein